MLFDQHQVRSRCRLTASTTWIGDPKGSNSDATFGGMTHIKSPLLHAILEESPSEDDSASSAGESSNSPPLRVCNTMIPVIPSQLHRHWTRPQSFRLHRRGCSGPPHQQPSLSNWQLTQRNDVMPRRMTSSEETCNIETSLPASGLLRRPGWLAWFNVNQH
jgi:hypothetical protein